MEYAKVLADPGAYIDLYKSENYIVFDFETTNIEKGNPINPENEAVLLVWYNNKTKKWKKSTNLAKSGPKIWEEFYQADFLVAHNAKFDLQWGERYGLDLHRVQVFDTMVAAYVDYGNRPCAGKLSLDAVLPRYGIKDQKNAYIKNALKAGICPSEMCASALLRYCKDDVRLTWELMDVQRRMLYREGLHKVFFSRCLYTPCLADIELNGMFLDSDAVNDVYRKTLSEYTDVIVRLKVITGGINFRSKPQLSDYLYETLKFPIPKDRRGNKKKLKVRRKDGKDTYATNEDVLKGLKRKARTKKQKEFFELYSKANKLGTALSKNLEFFKGSCDENGGLFYASFNQCNTATHRLSSSGKPTKFEAWPKPKSVQFQNMPRIYKPLMAPRHEGWTIRECDEAALEFRGAGHLGRDKQILADIENEFDVHSNTAAVLFDTTYEWMIENKKTDPQAGAWRTDAKSRTFKPLFGGEKGTEKEEEYYGKFNERYSDCAKTQAGWVKSVIASKDKSLTLETGLKCYWPNARYLDNGDPDYRSKHQIYNLGIQNMSTAEIVPAGVIKTWNDLYVEQMESFIVNTVHDSEIAEVHPEETEKYDEIARKAFEDYPIFYLKEVYDIDFMIPLEAEIDGGKWWHSATCKKCGKEYNPLLEHRC